MNFFLIVAVNTPNQIPLHNVDIMKKLTLTPFDKNFVKSTFYKRSYTKYLIMYITLHYTLLTFVWQKFREIKVSFLHKTELLIMKS